MNIRYHAITASGLLLETPVLLITLLITDVYDKVYCTVNCDVEDTIAIISIFLQLEVKSSKFMYGNTV